MKFGTDGHEIDVPPLILAWAALGSVVTGLGLFGVRAPTVAQELFGQLPWSLQTTSWVMLVVGALISAVCIAKFTAMYYRSLAESQT